jgi:hypothetical protein
MHSVPISQSFTIIFSSPTWQDDSLAPSLHVIGAHQSVSSLPTLIVFTTCGKVSYRLPEPGLSKEESAVNSAVELGLDQVA